MPAMSLDISKFSATSGRVKSVDVHPTEPWLLSSLYSGVIFVYNYHTQTTFKQIDVTDCPIRSAKFVARKQWIVSAADDMMIRVHNIYTLECIKKWEAHGHFIRRVAIHPTQPFILSCSDDSTIRLWNWEKNFSLVRIYEGHCHYVMDVVFNPKDTNTFASASLDCTIKIWNLNSKSPNLTLEGHEDCVNSIDYYSGGDKPYLASASDDCMIKIWDYQSKSCVQTLEGHTDNVMSVAFHPEMPLILSGGEDGTFKMWNSITYRLEKSLNYGWQRLWSICCLKNSKGVALGFDQGSMFLKLGKNVPSASMDPTGKVVFTKNNIIFSYNLLQVLTSGSSIEDGEPLQLGAKELGICEFFPHALRHNFNGRLITAIGDGDYVIYTALQVRSKKFGNANDFVWDSIGGGFAVLDRNNHITVFDRKFVEIKSLKLDFSADCLFGGHLLGVCSSQFISLYDWTRCLLIRRIDVSPKQVTWNDIGHHLAIATDQSYYILRYNSKRLQGLISSYDGTSTTDEMTTEHGFEDALEVIDEVPEIVRSSCWVGDCFIYVNHQYILRYYVGRRVESIAYLDRSMYLLGYLPKFSKLVLIDQSSTIVTYTLLLSVINFQTAILRGDVDVAEDILPSIPEIRLAQLAQFLDNNGFSEWALEISNDIDDKFDLAIQLGKLDIAYKLALKSDVDQKWQVVSELALQNLKFDLAEECFWKCKDFSSLLTLFCSSGNRVGIEKLALQSKLEGKYNITFICLLVLNQIEDCINIFSSTGQFSQATIMALSYAPHLVHSLITQWKTDLSKTHTNHANTLSDPQHYPNMFPHFQSALEQEEIKSKQVWFPDIPSSQFLQYHLQKSKTDNDPIPSRGGSILISPSFHSTIENTFHPGTSPSSPEITTTINHSTSSDEDYISNPNSGINSGYQLVSSNEDISSSSHSTQNNIMASLSSSSSL